MYMVYIYLINLAIKYIYYIFFSFSNGGIGQELPYDCRCILSGLVCHWIHATSASGLLSSRLSIYTADCGTCFIDLPSSVVVSTTSLSIVISPLDTCY